VTTSGRGRGTAAAARALRARGVDRPSAAIILGSGLSSFVRGVEGARSVPYEEIPGFPTTAVRGHRGALVSGALGGVRVAVFAGRVHFYEGWSRGDVTFATRLASALGVDLLVVTNASGGIDPGFDVGDVMAIADQISMITGRGRVEASPPIAMADAYSLPLRGLVREVAAELGIVLREGVYMGSLGPTYETPAEIAMARRLGAHAVGMSTVAEVEAARREGMEVLGLSLITNVPLPGRFHETTHREVLEAGRAGGARLLSLVRGVFSRL
jgi:purine-nucleoside phosphorylase